MPQALLTFQLSSPHVLPDLLHELSLHHDLTVTVDDSADAPVITVGAPDTPQVIWDVRATVGLFDEAALETTDGQRQT